jgi:tRNA G37 N-methylase TrmD
MAVNTVIKAGLNNTEVTPLTAQEEQDIATEQASGESLYQTTQYQRDRASAYPSIAEQLDQIYHEGIDAWKETIAAVKTQHPKPEAN